MASLTMDTPQSPTRFWERIQLSQVLLWIAVLIVTFIALYPFAFAVITSFKNQMQALEPTYIPWLQFEPTLINWEAEFGIGLDATFDALKNSAVISIGSTILATILGTLTGYGLARFKFRAGNRNIVSWVLSQRFLPPVATLIPFSLMLQRFNLIDNLFGMILVNTTFVLPFAILIMRDFFADFPRELEEAALVDGANHFQIFYRVALPVAGPALAAAAIICFGFAWNEFLFASVLTNRTSQPYTLLVASTGTVRGIHFGFVSTRMLISVALPITLSLFVQRYIVRGLTLGAVKG